MRMEERKRDWGPHHTTVDSDDVSIPEAELQFHASVGRVLSRVVVIHCLHQLHTQSRDNIKEGGRRHRGLLGCTIAAILCTLKVAGRLLCGGDFHSYFCNKHNIHNDNDNVWELEST